MGFAAYGWLTPVAGALTQEAIDVAPILNTLARPWPRASPQVTGSLPGKLARDLGQEHRLLEQELDKLRSISDALDDAIGQQAVDLISLRTRHRRRERRYA